MWNTETLWFDMDVVFGMFAFGNALFGHFEKHKPKIRRAAKILFVSLAVAVLALAGLRWVAFILLGALALGAAYVYVFWLPKHRSNGWTGEPGDRYYDSLKAPEERRPGR